jgi:hypothetical protein
MSNVHNASSARSDLLERQLKEVALLLLEEHGQCREIADQGSHDATRYKRKAEHFEELAQQAKKRSELWHVQAKNVINLHNSLQLDALCHALQRNEAATTTVPNDVYFPAGYAQRLGEALQGNTHLSELKIRLQTLVPPSLGTQEITSFVSPLMRFIRTSKALRSVGVGLEHPDSSVNEVLVKEVLNAVFENECEIDKIACTCNVPIALFCQGFESCTTLKTLNIRFGAVSSLGERNLIEEAFRSCTASLESLRIVTVDDDLVTSILMGLKVSGCKLQELKLRRNKGMPHDTGNCSPTYWAALSEFTHAATVLKHVKMEQHYLDEERMDSSLGCLDKQSSICKLSLNECLIEPEAMSRLQCFMSTRKDVDTLGVSSLDDLVLEAVFGGTLWSRSSFAPMLWMNQNDEQPEESNKEERYATIGSHIRSLTLVPARSGGCEFLAELALCAHRVELTSLRLGIVNAKECSDLAEFLSKTSSLQELDLGEMDDEHVILLSLRINGTLQRETMPGEVQSRLANSFCPRNKHIAQLVQQVTETKPSRSRDQSSAGRDRSTQGRQGILLQSGKQITAVRASILLSGLRRLGESIGPITD